MRPTLLLLIFISTNTYALNGCKNTSTQSELTQCTIKKLSKAEKKLHKKVTSMTELMSEDKLFPSAHNKWLDYRDTHCKSVADIYSGGSMYNYALTQCKLDQTELRITTLETDYKSTLDIITKGAP